MPEAQNFLIPPRRMQSYYRHISIIYKNGKEIGRLSLTRTSANISGSATSQISYRLHLNISGQPLKDTAKAVYLGVAVDFELSWNSNIGAMTKMANQSIAFFHRNRSMCPKDCKAKCYKSTVLHNSKTLRRYMRLCNKIQHCRTGICTEVCGQVLLQ